MNEMLSFIEDEIDTYFHQIELIDFRKGQYSFDPLIFQDVYSLDNIRSKEFAKKVRNGVMNRLRMNNYSVKGWSLSDQLQKYKSFGVSDGRIRTVFYITIS